MTPAAKTLKLPPITEKEFMVQVCQYANLMKWTIYHTYDSRRSAKGFPDLMLVRPPRLMFVELKTETGKATAEQHAWLLLLGRVPGIGAYLWRPSDWTEIEKVLR